MRRRAWNLRKEIIFQDGRKCVLKPTSPENSQEHIDYMKKTPEETPFLLRYPDEVNFTLEGEQEI